MSTGEHSRPSLTKEASNYNEKGGGARRRESLAIIKCANNIFFFSFQIQDFIIQIRHKIIQLFQLDIACPVIPNLSVNSSLGRIFIERFF